MATEQGEFGTGSKSSSSSSRYTHHVFLSFRGSDVRYEFADLLYHALEDAGLCVFREEDDMEKGADVGQEIENVIRESKVALIIFSKDLASSPYCLEEVAVLMERWAREEVQVLPVFFKVHPGDVRNLRGVYAESFRKHEERFESNRLAAWKDALRQAAHLAGFHYQGDRSLSLFIRDVVAAARRLANLVMLDIPSRVFGQPYRFSGLERWVQDRSHDKRIALLHGTRGIGKKTIATVVANQNYGKFDAIAFLEHVADKSKKPAGNIDLQSQLLSKLTPKRLKEKKGIPSEQEGMLRIKESLQNKRVLILLADLDHTEQFFNLIGEPENLGKGSKIIVTSGNEQLLQDHLCVKFAVGPLTPAQSLELFSWHVFGAARPAEEYEGRVVAGLRPYFGNPSALKAYASLFTSLGMDSWDELLPGVNEDKKSSINATNDPKASFDSLEQIDKKLFLDMAFFYAGWDRDHVDLVLNNGNLYKKGGFDRLRTRHLISVDVNNKVTMSGPIIDMGREIVRQNTDSLGEPSNVWSPDKAFQILREQRRTERIRSFILDGRQVEARDMKFKTEEFTGMTELKLLQLVNIKLKGDFKDFPKQLVWFSWNGMSLHRMPENVRLEELVVLDLRNSSLQELWSGSRSLERLKILNLSHSHMLERTPDFSRLIVPHLERLILEGCSCLVEIHPSIEDLSSLVQLSLKGCVSLEELPMVGSPVILDVSDCTALRVMPNRSIESVKELRADQIAVDQLWTESANFSFSAIFPSLVKLSLVGCKLSDDEKISRDLAKLPSLTDLDLSLNLLTSLPEGLRARPSLRVKI